MKHIHFIAIGGSAMHNLAIALKKKGYHISGSDDEIFEPSRSNLNKHGLLPQSDGWNPARINGNIDAIILGMHAKKDNPELIKAQQLHIPVFSYPEFLYEQTKNKKRVAIAGSHGKTTTTSMVMHVLNCLKYDFDYMVGAHLAGFDTMVELNNKHNLAIFEADEYLSSPIDLRSKFLWYKPNITVITGIAWDHINVFPTFASYLKTFKSYIESLPTNATVIYYEQDKNLNNIIEQSRNDIQKIPYSTFSIDSKEQLNLPFFGEHNMSNLQAAWIICKELGVEKKEFIASIRSFRGATRRLQKINRQDKNIILYDFAHAPSKVQATVTAVKTQYSNHKLVACLELHTFSSLNKSFIPQYKDTLQSADLAIVYYNPNTVRHKGLEDISIEDLKHAFNHKNLVISTNSTEVFNLLSKERELATILIMTSGNFNGIDIRKWAQAD